MAYLSFVPSKLIAHSIFFEGNDQEIEFQEIESLILQNCSGDRKGHRGSRGLG